MNTTINKFIVAAIGIAIMIANTWFNQDWVVSEEIVNSIAGPVTAWLVYQIGNKEVKP